MINYDAFETKRLLLKPTSEEDAAFIIALFNSPKWLQFIGDRNVKTLTSAKTYIQSKITSQFERLGFATYTIIEKTNEDKIGTIGLYDRDGIDGIDIGFALLPKFEGNGYAYEAASKLNQLAFDHYGLPHLKAITMKTNIGSQKLLQRLQMNLIGTVILPDSNEELLLYHKANKAIVNKRNK